MEFSGFGGGKEYMQDILWVAVTIAFFMLSIAYVRFCDGVKGGSDDLGINHYAGH
jgi:hypothetical protein